MILNHNKINKLWGNFEYKNICLQIKTREDFTDPRFAEFIKDWTFTEKEYDIFLIRFGILLPTSIQRKSLSF